MVIFKSRRDESYYMDTKGNEGKLEKVTTLRKDNNNKGFRSLGA